MAAKDKHLDPELILLLKKGEESAFEEIYERYWEKMASCAYKLTKSERHVYDLLSDVFISLWRNRERLGNIVLEDFLVQATIRKSLQVVVKKLEDLETGEKAF